MATSVKSKLTDSERKKIQNLSNLGDISAKIKSLSPIAKGVKFVKIKESEKKPDTKEEIEKYANEYFKDLIEENENGETGEDVEADFEKKEREEEIAGARVLTPEPYKVGEEKNLENLPHIEDDGSDNANIKPKDVDELFKLLDDINEEHSGKTDKDYYKDLIPEVKESLGLEKLEEVKIDEDKIREQVEKSLLSSLNLEKREKERETERERASIEEEMSRLLENAGDNRKEISEIYDNAKIEASNTSLKRGLARSSIAVLSINGLESEKAQQLSDLAKNLSESLEICEKRINALKDELASSLESLDIEYAIEVNEKIKEETEELYKKQKEVIQFNNNVEKLESDYQAKRFDMLEDAKKREEELAKEYKGIARRTREEEIKERVLDYFSGLPKDQAIKELVENASFSDYLGESFFDVYYRLMKRSN